MQEAIFALKKLHNAPNEIAVQAVLGAINLAAQGHFNVDPIAYGIKPISLNLMGIVPTGGMKTTIFDEVCVGIKKYEVEQHTLLQGEKERFELENAIYKKECELIIKKKMTPQPPPDLSLTEKKEKMDDFLSVLKSKLPKDLTTTDLLNAPQKPKPIQTADYTIKKATLNGIIDKLKTQSMVGLASSEGGEFFNSHAFQGGKDMAKSVELSSALTGMWDGQPIERVTGMDTTKLFNRRVNMLFLLQEEAIRAFLSNSMFASQGFTHRFLISQCENYKKPVMDLSDAGIQRIKNIRTSLQPFHDRIYDIISTPFKIVEGKDFELDFIVLEMDKDARQLWQDFTNLHSQNPVTDLKDYVGFAERIGEHCLRIAANLAAFEFHADITKKDMIGAIELTNFYIQQRKHLEIEVSAKDPQKVVMANKMIDWIRVKQFDDTLRNLTLKGPYGYKNMDTKQRLDVLEEMRSSGDIEIYESKNASGRIVNKIRSVGEV